MCGPIRTPSSGSFATGRCPATAVGPRSALPPSSAGSTRVRPPEMKRLKAVVAVSALLLTAACATSDPPASARGHVTGKLLIEGGPIGPGGQQPGERPIPGTVQFTASGRRPVTARAASSGTFSVTLPAGTYDVSGSSPLITGASDGSHQTPCSQPLSVSVTAQHTTTITLTCIVP